MKQKTAIIPTRKDNYPIWYQKVIKASKLAEISAVRGCMVIKPWGYSLWENIVQILNHMFKKTSIKNAYFPLLIPLSLMEKEAEHVKGFAKECAIVTHNKLVEKEPGKLSPGSLLSEPLIIRPTSEILIGNSFSKWIKSHRDLPVLINQWSNVIRWEMRTRMFLRTTEFLWQEGHTAHSNANEAQERAKTMLNIYKKLAEEYLAIPVISGIKSDTERFPGAIKTLTIEAMMQDKKALQAGTSHFLGQNFAKASNITFRTKNDLEKFVWTTSWGVSTRLIGGIIMTHGDDDGIIMPPRIASAHIVIMPIYKSPEDKEKVINFISSISKELKNISYKHRKLVIEIDDHGSIGSRNWKWIKKGIPIRIEIGPKEINNQLICLKRRDKSHNYKLLLNFNEFVSNVKSVLDEIHNNLLLKAKIFQKANTSEFYSLKEFTNFFTPKDEKKPEIHGGFALSYWCGEKKCEKYIKDLLSVTIRCIPNNQPIKTNNCIVCNKKAKYQVVFAKAY